MFGCKARGGLISRWALLALPLATLHCGSDEGYGAGLDRAAAAGEPAPGEARAGEVPAAAESEPEGASLTLDGRTPQRIWGRYGRDDAGIEFSSASDAPLAGDVVIGAGSVRYDVHYDYAARQVVADGHGGALDRETHALLRRAVERVTERLGPDDPTLPLHEQMLFASLAMLEDSAGMPLPRLTFPLEPAEVDKSLGNDGVTCIERNTNYDVSFDYGGTVIVDEPITANASQCNGQCGPACARLTPWVMWTLDCLEHDACCGATSDDPCWTPLGECGDEYADAEADFLRGFDPFAHHCGG